MRARRGAITGALAAMVAVAPARAQDRDPRENEALTACLAGRVQQGIDLLAQLYVETGDANHIYNQGRCFEQNGRPAEAIPRFHEYLRKAATLSPTDRADAERHIHECEQARVHPTAPLSVRTDTVAPLARPSPPGADPPGSRRKPAVVLLGIGAGALAVGIAAGAGVRAMQNQVEKTWDPSKDQLGRRLELLQWGAFVASGLCFVAGAALYLTPVAGRDGVGVAIGGRL
jgi:hypothetical protein